MTTNYLTKKKKEKRMQKMVEFEGIKKMRDIENKKSDF